MSPLSLTLTALLRPQTYIIMANFGATLKGTNLRGQTPICGFLRVPALGGMFRRSASLVIPHHKSFAAIPSVSLVLLGHTNRSVSVSLESQRGIALL